MLQKNILLGVLCCLFVMNFANPAPALAQQAGQMRYNGTSNQMEFFDGSGWFNFGIELGLDIGTCTKAGEMEYDPLLLLGTYKYCNGTRWIRIVMVPISLYLCIGTREGTIDYDHARKTFLVCNGVAWTSIKGLPATTPEESPAVEVATAGQVQQGVLQGVSSGR